MKLTSWCGSGRRSWDSSHGHENYSRRREREKLPLALGVMVASAHAEMIHGRIVGVVDGDTVVLLDPALKQYRVRLQGIDAPESKQPLAALQNRTCPIWSTAGRSSREATKQDKYKRSVCKLLSTARTRTWRRLRSSQFVTTLQGAKKFCIFLNF